VPVLQVLNPESLTQSTTATEVVFFSSPLHTSTIVSGLLRRNGYKIETIEFSSQLAGVEHILFSASFSLDAVLFFASSGTFFTLFLKT
jgi:hypothetical protein